MAHILVVDDEPVNLEILVENLRGEGYETTSAAAGEEAWQIISAAPDRFDVILLDRMMPDIDGIEVLRRIKANSVPILAPVIMQTAMSEAADIADGVRAGAFYYLTKPFAAETLLAIVAAAVKDHRQRVDLAREARQAVHTLRCLNRAEFIFRSPGEVRDIATLVANVIADPGRVVLGLTELMLNAVEHGNLAITYDEKSQLIRTDGLRDEIERRLNMPGYSTRKALLSVERMDGEVRFLIRDEGSGFDWQQYLEMNADRAFDTHGRGIAMSKMISFDRLEYRGAGNEVLAIVVG
jgi:CheY-like chemotaxis protein/anti-sigma regulatory factor (Ser/Thr protein kinase)